MRARVEAGRLVWGLLQEPGGPEPRQRQRDCEKRDWRP